MHPIAVPVTLNRDEKDVVTACIQRERWAQKELYEAYYSAMMHVCLRYSNNDQEAFDILQEGFIKVFRYIEKYKVGTSLYSWIKRIMVNTAIDYYRKEKRRRTSDIDQAYDISTDDVDAVSQLSEHDILAAVQRLTLSYRNVFNLYVIEGYSHKEISEMLDISESTSRSNLVKARSKLRAILSAQQMNRYE